jgi:hypothetical protein
VSWSPHERTGQPARLHPGRARSGPAAGGSSCQSTCGDSDPPAELLRSGRSSSGSPMTAAALSVMVQISRSRPASNIRRTRAGRPSAMQGAASLSKAAPQALPHRGDRLVDQTCVPASRSTPRSANSRSVGRGSATIPLAGGDVIIGWSGTVARFTEFDRHGRTTFEARFPTLGQGDLPGLSHALGCHAGGPRP